MSSQELRENQEQGRFTPVYKYFRSHWKKHFVLILIILCGFILRTVALTSADIMDDEALNAMRAIGPLDYFESFTELSPVQTLPVHQWWQDLSYHDQPLVIPWIMHFSLKIFGQNALGVRLPSLIAGIASIFILYLVVFRLSHNKQLALFSALFLAISNCHVWASRYAFLESIELFFMLLTLYFLTKTFDNRRWWLAVGLAFGLAMMSKYFAVLLIPSLLALAIYKDRSAFRSRWPYLGGLISLIITSPIFLYNFYLYKASGHFDTVISSFIGVNPADYIQTQGDRALHMIDFSQLGIIGLGNTWIECLLLIGGIVLAVHLWKKSNQTTRSLLILIYSYAATFILIFSSLPVRKQYLVLLAPLTAWCAALATYIVLQRYTKQSRKVIMYIIGITILFQTGMVVNAQLLDRPVGSVPFLRTELTRPPKYYSYLDAWLNDFYKTHNIQLNSYGDQFPQLHEYQERRYANLKASEKTSNTTKPIVLVYDTSMDYAAVRWLFLRRKLYDLRAIMIGSGFVRAINEPQRDSTLTFLSELRIIVAYPGHYRPEREREKNAENAFYDRLPSIASTTETIPDDAGTPLFAVYTIQASTKL